MKKRIFKFLGLVTKKEFDEVVKYGVKKTNEIKDLKLEENAAKMYAGVLKKQLHNLPFEFELLLANYNKDQINALTYEIINKARNNPEWRELLDRWEARIKNAKETIDVNYGKDKKEAIDYN